MDQVNTWHYYPPIWREQVNTWHYYPPFGGSKLTHGTIIPHLAGVSQHMALLLTIWREQVNTWHNYPPFGDRKLTHGTIIPIWREQVTRDAANVSLC